MLDMVPPNPPSTDLEATIRGMLPDREVCEILILRFLNTANAVHPIVDPDIFRTEVAAFWEEKEAPRTQWLGLFLAVIALGHQLPVIPLPEGFPVAKGRVRGKEMMNFVRSLNFCHLTSGRTPSVRARRPCLAHFQTLLITILSESLALDWIDGNDVGSGLLALANRMAFTMGLHRDPGFIRDMTRDPDTVNRISVQDDAETRRRVGYTCSIA